MASSMDLAEFIIEQKGPISSMKLQKIVYYSQAWSLALNEKSIFDEPIEAWKNGPVVRNLLEKTRNDHNISSVPSGDSSLIDEDVQETITAVVIYYGQKSGQWLQKLVHSEEPWMEARRNATKYEGLFSDISYNVIISQTKMKDYYSRLDDIC